MTTTEPETFASLMREIDKRITSRKLHYRPKRPPPKPPTPYAHQSRRPEHSSIGPVVQGCKGTGGQEPVPRGECSGLERRITGNTPLFFARPGLRPQLLRKLKRGKLPIARTLDLHGMTIDAAIQAAHRFLSQTYTSAQQCACIIHGKGGEKALLKNAMNNWLRQSPRVLALASAQPQDGGTGALYVLLSSTIRASIPE